MLRRIQEELTEVGSLIETTVTNTRRVIDGHTIDLAGTIRFTTTDSFACPLMPPILKLFRECYLAAWGARGDRPPGTLA